MKKLDMSGVFKKLRERRATMDRKRFTSMAYHNAATVARKAGYSTEDAKAVARDISVKASDLFDTTG